MRRFSFTLVEMLVVVAIIAILAALLAPSLQKALEKAHTIGCINNEKQIGIASVAYSIDNNDCLPNKGLWGAGLRRSGNKCEYGTNFWSFHVLPYSGKKVAKLDDIKNSIFHCPNHAKTSLLKDGKRTFNAWLGNNYAANHVINGTQLKKENHPNLKAWNTDGNLVNTSQPQYQFAKLSKVKNNAIIPLAADSGTSGSNFSINDTYYKEASGAYSFRHENYQFICVLFVDGHAKPLDIFSYAYDTKNRERKFSSYWATTESFQ